MILRRRCLALLAAVVVLVGALSVASSDEDAVEATTGEVTDSSYAAPDGTRVLRQSIVVPAPPKAVWDVFTTEAGWRSLGIAFVAIDFRLGGLIETSYDPAAKAGLPSNIRNRILAYLPLRMLALQAEQAPPGFPAPELLPRLFSVFEFEAIAPSQTRITVSGVGYGEGEAFEKVYRLFERGNRWTLATLHERLAAAAAAR